MRALMWSLRHEVNFPPEAQSIIEHQPVLFNDIHKFGYLKCFSFLISNKRLLIPQRRFRRYRDYTLHVLQQEVRLHHSFSITISDTH